jgi:hypothetical protein
MLSLRSFLVAVLLSAAGQSVAKGVAEYDSLRLVSAMREDERMLRSVLVQKLQRTGLSEQDRTCLDRLDYPEITDIVASEIGGKLTAAEVRDAIVYFQSSSGRKVVKRELGVAGEVPFTAADQTALKKFQQRPAGRKLLRDLVLRNAAAMASVMARIDRHLKDCAFRRQSDVMRGISQESCRARPVASSNNGCLAIYTSDGRGGKTERASVEVNCRNDGRVLTSRTSLPDPEAPVALRWSNDRELKILVDGKIKSSPPAAGSSVKVSFAPRQKNDPPFLECVPRTGGSPSLAETLPPNVTVGAWRAYGRPGLCLMTARVLKKDVVGADGDMLLQFRRQAPAVPPFATTELALVVQIYQQREQPLLVDFGQKRLALIAHRPQQTHMLTGQIAEVVLQGLRSKPLELTVRRTAAASYSIPVRRLDFDFAYADFSECLAALAKN